MNFKDGLPIYIQIADRLTDEILAGKYEADGRVPAVREYSALLEVNVNTAAKAFDLLVQRGVLYNKRGLGAFVSPDAHALILDARRREFLERDLPEVFRKMRQLGLTPDDLRSLWDAETAPPLGANP